MALFVALGLGIASLAFVLYPLYKHERGGVDLLQPQVGLSRLEDGALEDAAQLPERELAARMALQEVELDYQLDNISEDDYRQLRDRYMRRALVALKSRYQHEQVLDALIEEQVRTLKEQVEKEQSDETTPEEHA